MNNVISIVIIVPNMEVCCYSNEAMNNDNEYTISKNSIHV